MPEQTFSVMQIVRLGLLLVAFAAAVFLLTVSALRGKWKNLLLDLGIFLLLPLLWSVTGNVLRLCFPGTAGWGAVGCARDFSSGPRPTLFSRRRPANAGTGRDSSAPSPASAPSPR